MKRAPAARHGAFGAAALAAILGFGLIYWVAGPRLAVIAAADIFFLAFLFLGFREVLRRNHERLRDWAGEEDQPPLIIFLFTTLAAAMALFYLFREVNRGEGITLVLVLALAAAPLGWAATHLMAAFHYARLYFLRPAGSVRDGVHGLGFPGTVEPDAWDFVYFSFVVGMTAQVSDVTVQRSDIRKFVLLHGVISFFMNTVILATVVNFVVSNAFGPQ
jgi:uncharacterized membrane protein